MKRIITPANGKQKEMFIPQCHPEPKEQIKKFLSNIDELPNQDPRKHWCGVCCLSMIHYAKYNHHLSLENVFNQMVTHGVYQWKDGDFIGAYHK